MKRADLIRSVAVQFRNLGSDTAVAINDAVFGFLQDQIAAGNRCELRGFGIFMPRKNTTKIGFNPKTGERRAVAASSTVKFRPSSKLISEMNK